MLPLNALMHFTPPSIVRGVNKYRMTMVTPRHHNGGIEYTAVVYGGSAPARPTLWLRDQSPESQVTCTCTCTYFQMHLEVVLAVYGVTEVKRAEGRVPKEKNPGMKPGLCPHLYLLALHVVSKFPKESADDDDTRRPTTARLRTLA